MLLWSYYTGFSLYAAASTYEIFVFSYRSRFPYNNFYLSSYLYPYFFVVVVVVFVFVYIFDYFHLESCLGRRLYDHLEDNSRVTY